MAKRTQRRRDEIEQAIESALAPGTFVGYSEAWSFVSELEEVASAVEQLLPVEPDRATFLYEIFIGGCYDKADEIDDSGGYFGMFVESLFCDWIRARQAAGANRDETATLLLDRIDDDPYGFCYEIEQEAVEVFDREGRRAFERQVRARFDAGTGEISGEQPDREDARARRRWGTILRAIYAAQRNVDKYVEVCEQTELRSADCKTVAVMLRAKRKPEDALTWVDRGLTLEEKSRFGTASGHELADMKRALLTKLGRGDEAQRSAWAEFQDAPSRFTYEKLMKYVPEADRARWHGKAMTAVERGDLHSLIELWLATKEIDRLVERLREVPDAQLEGLSHYALEPVAKQFVQTQPDIAAKLYRALGMRILNERKSKYYDAALSHFEDAMHCYEQAGLGQEWDVVVAQVRKEHYRKVNFMPGFERLVAGELPSDEPSFAERARSRWSRRSGA